MRLVAVPVTITRAKAFTVEHHRHNKRPGAGARFAVGVSDGVQLVGVALAGNPRAEPLNDGFTLEVYRNCVREGAPNSKNACSFLYGCICRAWRAVGGRKVITYTKQSECGASLRAAGFKVEAVLKARRPDGWANRAGRVAQAIVGEPKYRWARAA